jgi:hypothetical protein
MNYKKINFWVLIATFVGLMLSGCAASVPVMPGEHDALAEKFQPAPGMANVYVVREEAFTGSAVLFSVDIDGKCCGGIAPGTYHLLELSPGKHTISVATQENEDHEVIDVTEGKNYFVEIKPKMGWMSARVSVEQIDAERGKQLVIDGERAETLPLKLD